MISIAETVSVVESTKINLRQQILCVIALSRILHLACYELYIILFCAHVANVAPNVPNLP